MSVRVSAIQIRFLYLRKFVQCVCESYLIVVAIVVAAAAAIIVVFMRGRFTVDCYALIVLPHLLAFHCSVSLRV